MRPRRPSIHPPHPTRVRPAREDGGWVLIPVIILMVVALGLGFALLMLVDNQTNASAQQRDMDAAQALAEGVATSTANVLAANATSPDWSQDGCQKATGQLTGTSTNAAGTLGARIEAEARRYFADKDAAGDVTAYGKSGRSANWTVNVCPTTDNGGPVGTDMRFDDDPTTGTLKRTGLTGSVAGLKTLWVQAQANIVGSTESTVRARSVAAKVKQDSVDFVAPTDTAVSAGSFSTGLSGGAGNLLTGGVLGNLVLGKVLGATPMVTDTSGDPSRAKIGVRCGLLNGLGGTDNLDLSKLDLDLCVSGVLAGTNKLVTQLGAGALTDVLGTNRFASLDGFTVTTPRAIAAYRDAAVQAKRAGTGPGPLTPPGYGSTAGRTVTGPPDPSTTKCVTDSQWASIPSAEQEQEQSVIFIDQVGDGNQYCTLDGDHKAKILVVARGGVRVTGHFTGVVYALNLNECDVSGQPPAPDMSACTNAQRAGASKREVVRIDSGGQVRGAIWADGAKGQVGIYPADLNSGSSVTSSLLSTLTSATDNRLCELSAAAPLLGPLLTTVTDIVGDVLNLVGGVLNGVLGIRNQAQSLPTGSLTPTGDAPPPSTASCSGLKAGLASLNDTELASRLGLGGSIPVGFEGWTRRQTKGCGFLGLGWCPWGPWTKTSKTSSTSVVIPGDRQLLDQILGLGSTLTDVANTLSSVLNNKPPAVIRDEEAIKRANIGIPDNAAFVPGTFRNVPVATVAPTPPTTPGT